MNFIDKMIDAVCKWILHFIKNEKTREKIAKIVNLEFATYIIAGILTTLVNWLVSYLLNDIAKIEYATVTNAVAWIVAVIFAYWINNVWVFKEKFLDLKSEIVKIIKFFISRGATGVIEIGGPWILVDLLEFPFWPVKIIISVAVIILNYVFSKLFVFIRKKSDIEYVKEENKVEKD